MIKKLLIANRGEIAVRIIRACTELNIRSVAIYSEADRYSLHVKHADESYCIGPESLDAYLNCHRIINVALTTQCDALHPGVGFLSENPSLPRLCANQGITFVGPDADTIAAMGDKTKARALMQKAGVPIIPGSEEAISNSKEAVIVANQLGYPVMLKASLGGGGRGIRCCHDDKEVLSYFETVRREATKAFGASRVFIEKAIVAPKHIEVQILGDKHGNIIHLFERDCSIQRRHQKLIEIAPSIQITTQQRQQVCALALKAAKAVRYENAGTIEFLLDNTGNFYFLEMNTRLQVEHTVTEQITGVDIVQQQILISAGHPIAYSQSDIQLHGYAADFRINAEDPRHDFLPSFGRITRYYAPGGPGVRTDSAIYTGYEIPPFFDSMCAKVTVWALTWEALIARAKRALQEMRMAGIKTTIPYYLEILNHEEFTNGHFSTDYIERHPELLKYSLRMKPRHLAIVIAAALVAHLE